MNLWIPFWEFPGYEALEVAVHTAWTRIQPAEVPFPELLEHLPRLVEPPPGRGVRTTDDASDLQASQLLDIPEYQDDLVFRGEALEEALHPARHFLPRQVGIRWALDAHGLLQVFERNLTILAPLAQGINAEIDHDAVEPGVEVLAELKSVQGPKVKRGLSPSITEELGEIETSQSVNA